MAIGTIAIVAKETAEKAVKETAKQIAKETKKDVLKEKLKKAVKAEVKEEIKDRAVDEIDDNVMDVGTVNKASEIAKGEGLKGKLSRAVKSEAKERAMEDVNDNIVDTGTIQKGKTAIDATKTPTETQNLPKNEASENKAEKAEKEDGTASSESDKTDEGNEKAETYEPNSYVTIDGERYRTDDNGNIYQKRNPETGTYEGLPNISYDLNGYHYETDSAGRIKKASGTLQERNHEGRPAINDNVNGMKENDEKGHLIGDQFNGSNLNGNLVAMDFDVNRSDYKKLEGKLSKHVNEDHKKVEYSIEPKYEGDSSRPTKFVVKYTVDGETFKETFKN